MPILYNAPHLVGANALNSVLKGTAVWYTQCMSSCTIRVLDTFPYAGKSGVTYPPPNFSTVVPRYDV